MFRQSSSRNQRSKGFKVKHVLQIFLLLAICIWLLYQVKHSHDKKKAFNGRNGLVSDISEDQTINTYNLGRKDLKPHIPVVVTESESQNEEDEPEEVEEEPKMEDIMEDEGKGAGDDEIDEHDLENENEENEQGKDLEDDEEKDSEDKEENHDTEASDESTQTAREEQYHGDNASSAVLKDTNTEKEDGHGNLINGEEVNRNQDEEQKESENDIRNNGNEDTKSNDNELNNEGDTVEKNNETQQSNNVTVNPVIVVEERETVEIKSNMTSSETNDHIQLPNNLTEADSGDHMEVQSNSTAVKSTDHTEPQGNSTATEPDDQTELKSTMVADEISGLKNSSNPGGTVESLGLSLQNETLTQDENSSVQMETHGEEDHSDSENVDAEHTDGSNTTAAMVGLEGSSTGLTESDDPLVSEVTDAHVDLSTLTNVLDEGRSVEDVAAE